MFWFPVYASSLPTLYGHFKFDIQKVQHEFINPKNMLDRVTLMCTVQYLPSPLKIKFLSRNVGSKSSQAGEKVIKTLFSVQLSGLDKADNLLKCENWPSVKFSNCF